MKKFFNKLCTIALCICLCASIASCGQPSYEDKKDEDYLYNWLLENGELVNGTSLIFSNCIDTNYTYELCYSTEESERYFVKYTIADYEGYRVNVQLPVFTDFNLVAATISLANIDGFTRGLKFYHDRETFQKRSPISHGDSYGDTIDLSEYPHEYIDGKYHVDIPYEVKVKLEEMDNMNALCESLAQPSIREILDWLNTSVCPLADMDLSDFGYEKYNIQ